jgi:signal transduction histidine kinase
MVPEALKRRRSRPTTDDAAFSAALARERGARTYIVWLMPGVLVLVSLLTLTAWLQDPTKIPLALWGALASFWVLQAIWIGMVRLGVSPLLVAGLSLIADGVIEYAAMYSSPEPVGSSSSLTFFVVAASYFLPATGTVLFATACAVGITYAAHHIAAWGDGFFFPSTAFVVLITGAVCAFIMSRVRRTEARLEALAAEQLAARERLEQVDRARDRLIANVSHELRTPLTSTIGSIETLLRDDVQLDEVSRDRLMHVARDGGLRLLALVEDLLTIGATRPDSLELASQPERLGTLAHDAIVGIGADSDREIRVEVAADPLVRVDRLRMLQVIGNLVVNAVRHGTGNVVIETSRKDGEAMLRVIDDGPGVDPQHVNELFLPFARFSTRPDSTGLGLAICRTIVEAHGGQITYSRLNGPSRTCFTVRLPLDA